MSCIIYMDELPSAGVGGALTDEDWACWQELLTDSCDFNPVNELITTMAHGEEHVVNSRRTWRSACLLHLEDLTAAGEDERSSLRVYFMITRRSVSKRTKRPHQDDREEDADSSTTVVRSVSKRPRATDENDNMVSTLHCAIC